MARLSWLQPNWSHTMRFDMLLLFPLFFYHDFSKVKDVKDVSLTYMCFCELNWTPPPPPKYPCRPGEVCGELKPMVASNKQTCLFDFEKFLNSLYDKLCVGSSMSGIGKEISDLMELEFHCDTQNVFIKSLFGYCTCQWHSIDNSKPVCELHLIWGIHRLNRFCWLDVT